MNKLADLLRDPAMRDVDVDGNERLRIHADILARKRMLREVFTGFHHLFDRLDRQFLHGQGKRIEIGAGVAPMRDTYPDVLATDVVPGAGLDRVLDAQAMDLEPDSVRTIIGQNCFHHLPQPELFFLELEKVLSPGGGAILLEPYYGALASLLYPRLFRSEGYDKNYPSWETPATGPMNGANQALSFIVFKRDRAQFEQRFPRLRIVHEQACDSFLMYLLSGGLNFRQLAPDWMSGPITLMQRGLTPALGILALHHVIVLRKES